MEVPVVDAGARHDAAFLSQVLSEAPVPLWVIDPAGLVALANQAAVRFLGHRSGIDVLGGSSHDLLHRHRPDGSPYPPHECPIIGSSDSLSASEWFVTRSGDVRPVRWSTQPVGGSGDVLLSFTASTAEEGRALARPPEARASLPSPADTRARLLEGMRRSIEHRFADAGFSSEDLALEARISVRSVQAIFQEAGTSPAAEIRRRRLRHARTLLEDGHPVHHACHASGFSDVGTFARAYRQQFELPPSRTRSTARP
jgi:PAS domain S-box-containing protein